MLASAHEEAKGADIVIVEEIRTDDSVPHYIWDELRPKGAVALVRLANGMPALWPFNRNTRDLAASQLAEVLGVYGSREDGDRELQKLIARG